MKKKGVLALVMILVLSISFSLVSAESNETETNNETEEETCLEIPTTMLCPDETILCPIITDEQGCPAWDCDACETELECEDSDGGKDYYVRGTLEISCVPGEPCPTLCGSVPAPGEPSPTCLSPSDWCADEFILNEGYCENGNILFEEYICPDGCENGVCIRGEEPPEPDENGREGDEPKPDEPPYEVETCAVSIKVTLDKDVYYYGDIVEVKVKIVDAGGVGLANYPFRSRIFTYGDGLWHTGESSRTNEQGIFANNEGRIEKGKQSPGKIKLKVTTAPNIRGCGPVEDSVELEIRRGEDTEEVCGIGVCVPEKEEVENIPEDKVFYTCSGCELEGKCYPMGYRKSGKYCSENYEFVGQLDRICENNFECKSNVCISGECVGEGLMRKIIKWFKKMFGGGGDEEEDEGKERFETCSKLLIEKDIGDYKYGESFYGDIKEAQVPLYSEDGEQIDIVKCCVASYLYQGEMGGMGLVCPFDNKKDVKNSLEWLLIKNTNLGLSKYKGENILKDSNRAIVWTSNVYIVASGGDPSHGTPLAEDIVDAYLKKYKNDLEDIEISPISPPEHHDPTEEFLRDIESLGTLTLIDFETIADGIVLQNGDKLTGKEWESLGVVFEFPGEDYLQVFGPMHPFNPLDKLSLSPGLGPFEAGGDTHDDLNIIFSEPVKAAGLYLLDLGDTDERESITFLDENNNVIEKISPWPKSTFGNPAPGTFVSLVHDGISKIEILENTQDGDDIAYDNLYFVK